LFSHCSLNIYQWIDSALKRPYLRYRKKGVEVIQRLVLPETSVDYFDTYVEIFFGVSFSIFSSGKEKLRENSQLSWHIWLCL